MSLNRTSTSTIGCVMRSAKWGSFSHPNRCSFFSAILPSFSRSLLCFGLLLMALLVSCLI